MSKDPFQPDWLRDEPPMPPPIAGEPPRRPVIHHSVQRDNLPQSTWGAISFVLGFLFFGELVLLFVIPVLLYLQTGNRTLLHAGDEYANAFLAAGIADGMLGIACGIVALTDRTTSHKLAKWGLWLNAVPFVLLALLVIYAHP
jgi:hypothetical protein